MHEPDNDGRFDAAFAALRRSTEGVVVPPSELIAARGRRRATVRAAVAGVAVLVILAGTGWAAASLVGAPPSGGTPATQPPPGSSTPTTAVPTPSAPTTPVPTTSVPTPSRTGPATTGQPVLDPSQAVLTAADVGPGWTAQPIGSAGAWGSSTAGSSGPAAFALPFCAAANDPREQRRLEQRSRGLSKGGLSIYTTVERYPTQDAALMPGVLRRAATECASYGYDDAGKHAEVRVDVVAQRFVGEDSILVRVTTTVGANVYRNHLFIASRADLVVAFRADGEFSSGQAQAVATKAYQRTCAVEPRC